jgi:hypothetical protein
MKRGPEDRVVSIPKPVGDSRRICPGGCGEEFSSDWLKWRGGCCRECELQKQIDNLSSRCARLEKEVTELKEQEKRHKKVMGNVIRNLPDYYTVVSAREQEEEERRRLMFAGVAKNPISLEDVTKNLSDPRE